MSDKKFISMDEARRRIGEAIFRDKWTAELTNEERRVLLAGPEDFPEEYYRAKERYNRAARQYERAESWLYANCLTEKQADVWDNRPLPLSDEPDPDIRLDRKKFERLLASAFPSSATGQHNGPVPESVVTALVGANTARMGRVNAETTCGKWLAGKMRASPKARPKSRSDFWSEAKGKFPDLTGRGFE
ncbi:MAG: hypothetical protein WA268_17445, partial [Xanthobacteraceae bacterium]